MNFIFELSEGVTTVGSIAQPSECVEEAKKYKTLEILGSNVKWDYNTGCEVEA